MQKLEIKQRPLLTRPEKLPGVPAFVAEILARRGVESEQELELNRRKAHTLLEALKEQPADTEVREELRQNLQSLTSDADLVVDEAKQGVGHLQAVDGGAVGHGECLIEREENGGLLPRAAMLALYCKCQ